MCITTNHDQRQLRFKRIEWLPFYQPFERLFISSSFGLHSRQRPPSVTLHLALSAGGSFANSTIKITFKRLTSEPCKFIIDLRVPVPLLLTGDSTLSTQVSNDKSFRPVAHRRASLEPKTGLAAWLDLTKIACFVLHVGVVVIYLFLSFYPFKTLNDIADPNGVETDVKFLDKTWEGGDLSTSTSKRAALAGVTGHLIGLTFSTVMVLLAQCLALRRQFNMHGPLTAKHDTDTAWSGLGSSLLTLARQLIQRSALGPILRALVYLGGIALFNTVAAAAFGVVYMDNTETVIFATSALPDFSTSISNVMTGASALLTLGSIDYLLLPGFTSGTLFDLPVNFTTKIPASTSYEASATYFNVTCGYLGDHAQINMNEDNIRYLMTDYRETGIAVPQIISRNGLTVIQAPWGRDLDDLDAPGLVLLSTVPITDSEGNFAPTSVVSPPITYVSNSSESVTITSITAMGCNLTTDPLIAQVNTIDWSLLSLNGSTTKNSSTMGEFPRVMRTTPMDNFDPVDSLYNAWSVMPVSRTAAPDAIALMEICQSNGNEVCEVPFAMDQFAMQELNLYPDLIFSDIGLNSSLLLHDVEAMMSNMSAISFWSQTWGQNHKFSNLMYGRVLEASTDSSFITHMSQIDVYTDRVTYILTLNMTYIYLGLAISILLLLLVLPLVFDRNTLPIDSGGILPMIWLLSDRQDIMKVVEGVEDPTTNNLRKAGMVDASFGVGGAWRGQA